MENNYFTSVSINCPCMRNLKNFFFLPYLYWQLDFFFYIASKHVSYIYFQICSTTTQEPLMHVYAGDDLTLALLASICWGSNPDKVKDAWKCKGEQLTGEPLTLADLIKTMLTYNSFLQRNIFYWQVIFFQGRTFFK